MVANESCKHSPRPPVKDSCNKRGITPVKVDEKYLA